METSSRAQLADLEIFQFSGKSGFVEEEPLTELPTYYGVWMDLASNLTTLIESHTLRDKVNKMPLLSVDFLGGDAELRLAHLALGSITMGYVWQEGRDRPAQILPKSLALPFWLVSRKLGLHPILLYVDALCNWKLKDPGGEMEYGNMDLIFSFPGGESCRGFLIISVLVELAATPGIKAALEVMRAMEVGDLQKIQKSLHRVAQSMRKMKETFKLIHKHVDPTDFYQTLRVFFTGWRDNPSLPDGLIYEGVSSEPIFLSGVTAAQSQAVQCFNTLLRIRHEDDTGDFLTRMRDHMLPSHRQLIRSLYVGPSLRDFIVSSSDPALCHAYNDCVSALLDIRSYHLSVVAKYIVVPSNSERCQSCPFSDVGTGGSDIMSFLKHIRDATKQALLSTR